MPNSLDIQVRQVDGTVRVIIDGEVDLAAEDQFEAAIEQAVASSAATIVIDLDQVSFLDAAGLGLIARHAWAGPHRQRFRLTQGSRAVQRVLDLTGLRTALRGH